MSEFRTIRELCSVVVDCPHSTPKWTANGKIVIRNKNIKHGKIDFSSPSYTDDEHFAQRIKRAKPQPGDIIITREAPIGDVGMIPENTECCLGQRMVLLRANQSVCDNFYLLYSLQSLYVQHQISWSEGTGTTVSNLRIPHLEQIQIPYLPLEQQAKISSVLRALEEKIENNRRLNDNLYAQAKAIFAQRFIGIETIPDGWKKGNLLDIANYLNGLAMQKFRPRDDEVGLPVLKIKELRQGSCDVSSELCSPSIKPEYIVHDGDVIFSWSGSLLVDIWCGGTCGLNQHLFKVTSETYDQWFYYLWTAHHLERFIAIAADKATTMGHIKRGELEKAEVLIPSEKDYKEISSLMNPLFNLIIANRIEARKLAELRDELLPKLMSGEIDVSEVSV